MFTVKHTHFQGFSHSHRDKRFRCTSIPLAQQSRVMDYARFGPQALRDRFPDNKLLTDATERQEPFVRIKSLYKGIVAGIKAALNGENPVASAVKQFIQSRYILGERLEDFQPHTPVVLPPPRPSVRQGGLPRDVSGNA